MIRLHRLDHVCLRVADLDEASARWQLQFALVERSRTQATTVEQISARRRASAFDAPGASEAPTHADAPTPRS